MSTLPPGIILVGHEVLAAIDQSEMLNALPDEYKGLPRHHVALNTVKTSLPELGTFDWFTARQNQDSEVLSKLRPLIEQCPGWRIQYFGAAPIPLATALGYQLGGWANVDIYQKLHGAQDTWKWPGAGPSAAATFNPLVLPEERIKTHGDFVIRLSISHRVDPDDTNAVISEPIGEIDVALVTPNVDGLQSPEDLASLQARFSEVINWAHQYRPNTQIHVFSSATVGAALSLGLVVNPTIHNSVHMYQYFGSQSPRYQRAFVLQQPGRSFPVLSEEDQIAMVAVRTVAGEELDIVKAGAAELAKRGKENSWLENLFPGEEVRIFGERFTSLKSVFETPLQRTSIALDVAKVSDGFSYNTENKKFELGDDLLFAISSQIPDEQDRRVALRLLLLHEGIHLASHKLTAPLAQNIRRFPKVVEELDYQADTWAYLNEVVLAGIASGKGVTQIRDDLLRIVKIAISTFWAFDASADPTRMEIRRINRYLIWYWQRLQIEALPNDVSAILKVLASRPIVEVSGPAVRIVDGRVFFLLDEVSNSEIGLLSISRLYRFGNGAGSQVAEILAGFRDRDDKKIAQALRSIFDQQAV